MLEGQGLARVALARNSFSIRKHLLKNNIRGPTSTRILINPIPTNVSGATPIMKSNYDWSRPAPLCNVL